MNFPIIILAGGKGTRIKKLTKQTPKALIKIYNKPFIEYQINYLIKQGIKKIIISVGYHGNKLINHFKNKKFKNVNISFSKDGEKLIGTGGAVKKIMKKNKGTYYIIYGDSFLPIKFYEIKNAYIESKNNSLMVIYKNNKKFDKSNVLLRKNKFIYDKKNILPEMQYIDYGLCILNSKVFDRYSSKRKFELSELYNKLTLEKKMSYKIVNKKFYEIGSYKGINNFKKYIKNNEKIYRKLSSRNN